MVEYYGTTSEVSWLFLLASWVVALGVVCLLYGLWNRAGLRMRLGVLRPISAPGSPVEDLPAHVLRTAPLPAPIFEGDGLEIQVGLDTSGAPRGPARLVGFIGSERIAAATGIVPRSGWTRKVELRGMRRGPIGARGLVIESSDVAGLFSSRRPCPDTEVGLVLPRFASMAGQVQARELEASVAAPRAGSGTEMFGVREYRAGDSLRRIHWRSSARHGELVVREYEPPGVQTLGIFCDPNPAGTDEADQVARLAASEAWDCIRNGGRVMLWGPGLVPSGAGEARSFWAALEWLARYPTRAAHGEDVDPPRVSEAVAVASSGQKELAEALEMVRRGGGLVRAWIVGDAGRAQGAFEKSIELDGRVRHVGMEWPV